MAKKALILYKNKDFFWNVIKKDRLGENKFYIFFLFI